MGTRFTVGGIDFEALDYSVTEDSTGLALNDSSGGTGEVRVSVAKPSPEEIQNFPSPYPDARSLTPVVPAYLDNLADYILLQSEGGSAPSYEIVSVPETKYGVRDVLRLTAPPGSSVWILPNGGVGDLRLGTGNYWPSSSDLPPVVPPDPQTGGNLRIAGSYIFRQVPGSGVSLVAGWVGSGVGAVTGTGRVLGQEYDIATSSPHRVRHHGARVPRLSLVVHSSASSSVVLDIPVLGVFGASYVGSSGLPFTGFTSIEGYSTRWDSGRVSGTVSRYRNNSRVIDETPWVRFLAPGIFEGLNFLLEDPAYGRIPGQVESVTETDDAWEFTCIPPLGSLSRRNVTLPPMEGVASRILRGYVRVGGDPWMPIFVEPGLDSETLRIPRREGGLWDLIKQFAAGLNAEIATVDGALVLRRPRRLTTEPGRYFTRTLDSARGGAAPGVALETEALSPTTRDPDTGVNVYPRGFVNETLPVISVLGGETAETEIVLGSEVPQLFVPFSSEETLRIPVYDDLNARVGSFYLNGQFPGTFTDQDAIRVQEIRLENRWYADYFGVGLTWFPEFSLSIQRVPSSERTVRVTLRTPRVVDSDGRNRTFSLSSISGGVQVNGLRLFAPWEMSVEDLRRSEFPTGAGLSGDTAFDAVSSKNVSWTSSRISSAGYAAARRASGRFRTLSGTVDRLRPPYEANYYSAAPYEDAQEFIEPRTYGEVVSAYSTLVDPVAYGQVQRYWELNYESSIKTWVFGNVAGSRIWDEASNNYYRIRSATITPSSISFSAETDTVHGDVDPQYGAEDLTYEEVRTRHRSYIPLSYEQASAVGYLKEASYA